MRELNYQLMELCARCREGSRSTQVTRSRILALIANQLLELGYPIKTARALKPKHVIALIEHWKNSDLKPGTIKNRMTAVRWWAEKVDKKRMVSETNDSYGIERRTMFNGNKAGYLDLKQVARIDCAYVRMSLRLMAAFGLRREEAIKIVPAMADKGDRLVLKDTWCKGKRSREIEISTARQRALLNEAKELATDGAMIPVGSRYKDQMKRFENATLGVGIVNPHGLRHAYAQWLYKLKTGMPARAAGGPSIKDMTPEQREIHEWGRLMVSQALGHARPEITIAYGI